MRRYYYEIKRKVSSPFKIRNALLTVWWGFFVGVVFPALILTIVYILYAPTLPDPSVLEDYRPPVVSRIYSSDGVMLAEFAGQKRIWVPLEEVSPYFIKALMDTEDKGFLSHWGLDVERIFAALLANIQAGKITQGGSTITQQLARELFLTRQQILTRKIREALTAIRVEHKYSKEEILELYVNQNFMGKGAYGVQAASQTYFGKDACDLGPEEAAMLVGVLRAPSFYSANLERALRRRNLILSIMNKSKIMDDECPIDNIDSLKFILYEFPSRVRGISWKAPYFVDYVRAVLSKKFGEDFLYSAGVTVYTTLDYELQVVTEDTLVGRLRSMQRGVEITHYDDDSTYTEWVFDSTTGDSTRQWKQVNGAVFAVENGSGKILVMVGGKDFLQNQYNRVTQAIRQPGSSFKPFVYTTALDNGSQPMDRIDDVPGVWPMEEGEEWRPGNYDHKYMGEITLREALAQSRNLATVRLAEKYGAKTVSKYAHRMGITTPMDPVLSLAIGSSGTKLWDMVTAFSVFPNKGVRIRPYAIERVIDRDGTMIYKDPVEKTEVLSKGTAYVMLSMLKSVIAYGTGTGVRRFGFLHPSGGKTGTTNDYSDAWFIGFTKDMTAGVRVGYNDMTKVVRDGSIGVTGSYGALPTWTKLMIAAHPFYPTAKDSFDIPYDEVVFLDVCRISHELATQRCIKVREVFLRKNKVPTRYCPLSLSEHDTLKIQRRFIPEDEFTPTTIDDIDNQQRKRQGL